MITFLEGRAKDCVIPLISRRDAALGNLQMFLQYLDTIFLDPAHETTTARQLLRMRQGKDTVGVYWSNFSLLVQKLKWDLNSPTVAALFREGLNNEILDQLAQMPEPSSLDSLVRTCLQLSLRVERRASEKKEQWRPRWWENNIKSTESRMGNVPGRERPEPMELGAARPLPVTTSSMVRGNAGRGRDTRRCFVCGKPGHLARQCRNRKGWESLSGADMGEDNCPKELHQGNECPRLEMGACSRVEEQ